MFTTMITTRKICAALILTAAATTPALADYPYTPGYGYANPANYAPQVPLYPQPVANTQTVPTLSPAQIDQLTAAIALYPDPLLAQVLTAANAQQDIAAAAQYQQLYPNVDDYTLSLLPWDPSVKSLMRYPTVLQTLAQYPQWSANLGTAFTYQQADVLNSIQRWRIQAQLAGTLIPTPQQQVVVEQQYIRIQPVTQVIYVPRYDPCTVYRPQPYYASNAVAFSAGGSGFAFSLEFDWSNHEVHHNNNGQHWGNDGRGNDGPRNVTRAESRPVVAQQLPAKPQGQPIVKSPQAPVGQARIVDSQPAPGRDKVVAAPQTVTKPVAPKNVVATPVVATKQQPAPKSAAEQHKEEQGRKLLALSRL